MRISKKSPPYDIFAKHIRIIPWVSLDGFTVVEDGASVVSVGGVILDLLALGAVDNDAGIRTAAAFTPFRAGKKYTVEFPIEAVSLASLLTLRLYITKSAVIPAPDVGEHMGFRIDNADIKATNCDVGGTQKITDTGENISSGATFTLVKFVFDPGVDIKFYVDNVWKVTHTVNLPTSIGGYYAVLCLRMESAIFRQVLLGRILMENEI